MTESINVVAVMTHECPDGIVHTWVPRVPNPKACPRCKNFLNKPKDEDKKDQ